MLRWMATLVIACLLLAGCAGKKADDGADGPDDFGIGPPPVLLDSVPAPVWQVGQWWEWQTGFGTTTLDDTFCSIVVATDGASYTLATENPASAKDEAAFDHILLGALPKDTLAMSGMDGSWDLLDFPLTDGKTWTATIPNIAWDVLLPAEQVDVEMTATFLSAMATHGEQPDIAIVGKSGDSTLLTATYSPPSGWFKDLQLFDIDPGQEELEVGYFLKSHGADYKGPYFIDQATPVLQLFDANGFDDVPTEGGQPYTQAPQPHSTFTISTSATHVYGYVVTETVVGARAVVLLDPANQERHFESHDAALEGTGAGLFIDEPAAAGEWRLVTAGAGGFTAAFAEIFEVVEGAFTMA